ncbi:hypothetical protein OIA45_40710 (plasmid) [Streptomyces chartreusis]|uniref:hypothetical protein n=1 Tax=Streptomyces chartreusis TaxID=1969 RepID=UPI002F90965F|nr:hypothetical protein OIA45_40710 [Streptomyces chartreusis]
MENRARRRSRVRLARQRPRPDRIRASRAARGEAAQANWFRRIDWAHLGTVVAIIAGIGTLLFTGVSTFYGALVAQDQLEQSKLEAQDRIKQSKLDSKQAAEEAKQAAEEAQREARRQAILVSFWEDGTNSDPSRVHAVNRSPDPVQGAIVTLLLANKFDAEKRKIALWIGSIKPCSETIIRPSSIRWKRADPGPWEEVSPGEYLEPFSINCRDRQGVRWLRDQRRLLQLFKTSDPDDETYEIEGLYAEVTGDLPVTPVPRCGDDY